MLVMRTRPQHTHTRTHNLQSRLPVVANIVSPLTSWADKMLVDQIGDVTITNDGATILKQLEVDHLPERCSRLSDLQDQEVGMALPQS